MVHAATADLVQYSKQAKATFLKRTLLSRASPYKLAKRFVYNRSCCLGDMRFPAVPMWNKMYKYDLFTAICARRQLNWDQYMSAGKLLMLQLFLLLPYFNALFWSVVWARRRARVVAKLGAV